MRIDEYAEEYKQILSAVEKRGIHDPGAARVILQERAKDRRMKQISEERRGNSSENKDDPATEKQKRFLDSLGIDYPSDITKSEASRAITRAKRRAKAGPRV